MAGLPRLRGVARHLPAILGVVLLVGALFIIQREFSNLRLQDVTAAIGRIPNSALLMSGGATIASYVTLTLYDALGTRFVGYRLSYPRVAFASFTAYALAHNIGFAMLSGAAIRYRLYVLWGLSPAQIAGVVAFTSLTFVLGGLVLAGMSLLVVPHSIPFFGPVMPTLALNAVGVLMLAVVVGYLLLGRFRPVIRVWRYAIPLPGLPMALAQVALATADVALVGCIMWALLPAAPGLDFLEFLAVYVTAYTAAMASHVPGGLGVFDGTILVGLAPWLPAADILGSLAVFRLFYYIVPLFLAVFLFAGNEILLRRRAVERAFGEVGRWGDPFVVPALVAAVVAGGAAMLFTGALPLGQGPDPTALGREVADLVGRIGQFSTSVIGASLLVLAIGLGRRVTTAWALTIGLLFLGILAAFAQGQPWHLPAFLALIGLLLLPFRSSFYRDTKLRGEPVADDWILAALSVAICAVALGAFARIETVRDATWWELALSDEVPNGLRLSVGLLLVGLLLALWRLLRPIQVPVAPFDAHAASRYAELGSTPPGQAEGIVWGEAGRAGLPYLLRDGAGIALGDPAGSTRDAVSAIWRFRDLCEERDVACAFWRVGPEHLRVFADLGLVAVPLDQDGLPAEIGAPVVEPRRFLACRAERDLNVILPHLARLQHAKLPVRAL